MAAIASAGSGNWSSTTPNAPWPSGIVPGDGDTVTIGSGHTITLDQNLTIGADSSTACIAISSGGKLQYLSSAAAIYTITAKGDISVTGTLELGTVASPIGSTLGIVIEFTSASPSDGKYGLLINAGSTVTMQGASKTVVDSLNSNAAANATSLTTTNSTGWKDNDDIVVASTTRTATQSEKGQLNGDASGTTLTVDGFAGTGGGVLNAHSGTSPTKAEVINLTRNIKIRGLTTGMAYVQIETTATVDIDYVEFRYLGENATNKRGIEIKTTSGSCNIQYCSIYDCEDFGTYFQGNGTNNITYSNNVHYNTGNAAVGGTQSFRIEATSGSNITVSGNYWVGCSCGSNDRVILLSDIGLTFTNNVVAGSGNGSSSQGICWDEGSSFGTISGNMVHSCAGRGFQQNSGSARGTISTCTAYFNTGEGLFLSGSSYGVVFDTVTLTGNSTNIWISSGGHNYIFKSATLNGHATFTTGTGMFIQGNGRSFFVNSSFGATVTHTSQDIFIQNNGFAMIELFNTTLASSSEVGIQGGGNESLTTVRSHKNDASSVHKIYSAFGQIASEVTTRHTASGLAWKMTPSNSTNKLRLPLPTSMEGFKVAAVASSQVTIKVWVYKDSSYNGTAPRLVVIGGLVGGIASDVTDSLTVAHSNWEELQVDVTPNEDGVIEWYVDCDGTAGNVFVDDASITQA